MKIFPSNELWTTAIKSFRVSELNQICELIIQTVFKWINHSIQKMSDLNFSLLIVTQNYHKWYFQDTFATFISLYLHEGCG